jgi:hypothetical protein
MCLDISLKTETRLVSKAQELGLSVDAFLERLLNDADDLTTSITAGHARELSVWHLGVRGSLHPRDLYDGVG